MTKPFETVEKFAFLTDSGDVGSDCKPFDELFPNIRELELENFKVHDGCHVDVEFPRLTSLVLRRHPAFSDFGTSIEHVVQKNPQIRSLNAIELSQAFLKFVSKTLTTLEKLVLTALPPGTESITFSKVNEFAGAAIAPGNLKLPNLETLQIRIDMNRDSCIEFIKKHTNLKRIYLESGSDLDDQLFDDIKSSLASANNVAIDDSHLISTKVLVDFIQNYAHAQIITFVKCTEADKKTYRKKFQNQWIIKDFEQCLTFERRQ